MAGFKEDTYRFASDKNACVTYMYSYRFFSLGFYFRIASKYKQCPKTGHIISDILIAYYRRIQTPSQYKVLQTIPNHQLKSP